MQAVLACVGMLIFIIIIIWIFRSEVFAMAANAAAGQSSGNKTG